MRNACKIIFTGMLLTLPLLAVADTIVADVKTMERKLLQEKAVQLPSANVNAKLLHVSFSQGFKTPLHTHEGPGPRYVLKGKVRIEDSGQTATFNTGEVFWESGQPMTLENIGEGVAEVLIFEMAPGK